MTAGDEGEVEGASEDCGCQDVGDSFVSGTIVEGSVTW